jgi:hypothetical protein
MHWEFIKDCFPAPPSTPPGRPGAESG